jgi:flavin-dependent dehydrogenase
MFDCDVVVVGGGPAGSTAAAALARAGRRVVLLERDRFPRFHIGESLLASVNPVFHAIGVADKVAAARFPQKWGATFLTPDGSADRYADFSIASEVPQPQTWQVPRADFDELLLRHAAESGADVRESHRVLDADFDGAGATVTVANAAGEKRSLRAAALVDASGRGALLGRKFGLRMDEPRLANVAVFSHYSGVPRPQGRRAGDIRVVARNDLGWFWLIPISDELMSVGAVLPREAFTAALARQRAAGKGEAHDREFDREALLSRLIDETPVVARLLRDARRQWPVRVERDFSFGSRAYAGDRWLLVGDAGSFLDPVFSTGVAIAMESGLEAALALHAALDRTTLTRRQFRRFERRQRLRYASFRRFVLAFYSRGFRDLFFQPEPPSRLFRALIAVFAGYWRPSAMSRFWVALFLLLVRLQPRLRLVPPVAGVGTEALPAEPSTLGPELRIPDRDGASRL